MFGSMLKKLVSITIVLQTAYKTVNARDFGFNKRAIPKTSKIECTK